jgi:hypothetical protein
MDQLAHTCLVPQGRQQVAEEAASSSGSDQGGMPLSNGLQSGKIGTPTAVPAARARSNQRLVDEELGRLPSFVLRDMLERKNAVTSAAEAGDLDLDAFAKRYGA